VSIRDTFDRVAAEYDAVKQRIIPGYAEMRAAVDSSSASAHARTSSTSTCTRASRRVSSTS
jgi:hypothetical protein